MHRAAWKGHKEIVELLDRQRCRCECEGRGRVPAEDGLLCIDAANYTHLEVARILIAKGADVNAKDGDGKTTLDAAILANKPETADLLRKHGGKTGEELKAEGK